MLRRVRLLGREIDDSKLGLTLFACIRETGASNLEPDVGYTDMLLVVFRNPSRKEFHIITNEANNVSFATISKSAFTNHPTIRSCSP